VTDAGVKDGTRAAAKRRSSSPALQVLLNACLAASIGAALLDAGPALCANAKPPAASSIQWPEGTVVVPMEDIDGVVLVKATVAGRRAFADSVGGSHRDTTGWFAVDTGAGYLALDSQLAIAIGIVDTLPSHSIDVAPRALDRFRVGNLSMDQVQPVLLFQAQLLSRVTDRPVLGLIGHGLIRDRALWIDYQEHVLALIPAGSPDERDDASAIGASRRLLRGTLSSAAVPVRFEMPRDGKVMVEARFTPIHGGAATPWLTLALDTGASKCTLFEDAVEPLAKTSEWKPEIHGLVAPTLLESSAARLCRVKKVEVHGASGIVAAPKVEVALIRNALSHELESIAQETVHGLLGYTFLERFRIACDYPHRVLWLDPIPDFDRRHEEEPAQVGIQFERVENAVHVVAVIDGSPAAQAGIRPGDMLVSVDGAAAWPLGATELGHKLEGASGTTVTVVTSRGTLEQTHRLKRRRLL
jgi:hypothetical protein